MSRHSMALRAFAGATLVAGLGVGAAIPASATSYAKNCPLQSTACSFIFQTNSSTVAVSVDKTGTSTTLLTWKLISHGATVCSGTYRPVDPPSGKTCRSVPVGAVTFTTPGTLGSTRVVITTGIPL